MPLRLRDLLEMGDTLREIRPGVWVTARPLSGPLSWRVRDAWAVLTGRADALTWPTADDPTSWCAIPRGAAPQEPTDEQIANMVGDAHAQGWTEGYEEARAKDWDAAKLAPQEPTDRTEQAWWYGFECAAACYTDRDVDWEHDARREWRCEAVRAWRRNVVGSPPQEPTGTLPSPEREPGDMETYDEGFRRGMAVGREKAQARTLALVASYIREEISTGKLAEMLEMDHGDLADIRDAVQGPVPMAGGLRASGGESREGEG